MTTPNGAVTSGKEGKYARLNNNEAWCIPQLQAIDDVFRENVYLEIDLVQERSITALALQGLKRYGYGEKIRIQYDIGGNTFYEFSVVSCSLLFIYYIYFFNNIHNALNPKGDY